jgi:hypothetical protein
MITKTVIRCGAIRRCLLPNVTASARSIWTACHRDCSAAAQTRRPVCSKQELASINHLCRAGLARGFARRGFHLTVGERCGDHDVTTYLAQIDAMKRGFLRFADDRAVSSTARLGRMREPSRANERPSSTTVWWRMQ